MGRPAKKKSYWEAKKKRAGELQAELEYAKHTPLTLILKNAAIHMLDRLDPLETGAIAVGTVLVHGMIIESPQLKDRAARLMTAASLGGLVGLGFQTYVETIIPKDQVPGPLKDDWVYWAASFFISFVICKYGGQLIGLLDKGIPAVASMLLGAA